MLTNKNKSQLRTIAHQNKDLLKFNIGKSDIDENVIKLLDNALTKYELIKIAFLKSSFASKTKEEMILDVVSGTKSDLVQSIGNTIIIYKPNLKLKDHIVLNK
jgi:RNA-binding protein